MRNDYVVTNDVDRSIMPSSRLPGANLKVSIHAAKSGYIKVWNLQNSSELITQNKLWRPTWALVEALCFG